VKKFSLSGLMAMISIIALAALAYGEMRDPGAKPEMFGGSGMAGHQMGQGMPMGHGMMMGHGMGMGSQEMGHDMMCGCGMRAGMKEGMGDRMKEVAHHLSIVLKSLNLDEQQRKMIQEIKSKIMIETIRKMADIRITQIEIKDLLFQDPMDMKTIEAKVKQLGMIRTDMHLSHIKALEEIKARLTPEQRKKFGEMWKTGPMMGGMEMMHK
jgi:Spy/CpxP family protein refolding chaperone